MIAPNRYCWASWNGDAAAHNSAHTCDWIGWFFVLTRAHVDNPLLRCRLVSFVLLTERDFIVFNYKWEWAEC